MIINQYQPENELKNLVEKEQFQKMDIILDSLDENKKINVEADFDLLGHIHHALNLDKYSKKEFRRKLFEQIPAPMKKKYFEYCRISKNTSIENAIKKSIEFEWGPNDDTEKFITFFKYPKYLLPTKNNLSNHEPYKMLFDFQFRVAFDALKVLKNSFARVLIQMPTGTGKTRTAMELIIRLMNQKNNEFQIIWFANKAELLDQALESFNHLWGHAGKGKINVIKIWGTEPIPKNLKGKSIIFAGYQKFNSLKTKIHPNYVFLDEAHQILAPTYEGILNSIIDFGKFTRVIGLTATPGRGINRIQNERLVKKFYENIIPIRFDDEELDEQYENNVVEYLEDQGILSKVIPEPLDTDFTYELSEEEWKHLTKLVKGDHPDYSKNFLKKLANDNLRNVKIIHALRKYAEDGKKILYFSTDKEQSKLVYVILQKLGVKAVHVDGETNKKFRKQIIENFKKSNEISVICNYDIFATGFDVPNLDVVFIARPVNSPVLFNQIVGRGTRGEKMGGKSEFTLVQVVDKIKSPFLNFKPYEQYGFWDNHWKNE
jgi:DNA repair protein RadD